MIRAFKFFELAQCDRVTKDWAWLNKKNGQLEVVSHSFQRLSPHLANGHGESRPRRELAPTGYYQIIFSVAINLVLNHWRMRRVLLNSSALRILHSNPAE